MNSTFKCHYDLSSSANNQQVLVCCCCCCCFFFFVVFFFFFFLLNIFIMVTDEAELAETGWFRQGNFDISAICIFMRSFLILNLFIKRFVHSQRFPQPIKLLANRFFLNNFIPKLTPKHRNRYYDSALLLLHSISSCYLVTAGLP